MIGSTVILGKNTQEKCYLQNCFTKELMGDFSLYLACLQKMSLLNIRLQHRMWAWTKSWCLKHCAKNPSSFPNNQFSPNVKGMGFNANLYGFTVAHDTHVDSPAHCRILHYALESQTPL